MMRKINGFAAALVAGILFAFTGCGKGLVAVEKVEITAEVTEVLVDSTIKLTATVSPADATDSAVTWSSDNEEVAKVDSNGVVTGVKAGKATITAKAGEKSATVEITVAEKIIAVTEVKITVSEKEVIAGKKITLTAKVSPENATDKTVTWSSDNEEVAKVDASGVVTGVKSGIAKIKATAGGVSSEEVTVVIIPADFVKVPAVSITGTETWTPSSEVFVSERALEIASFYMCDHEVTQDEFKAVMGRLPSTSNMANTDGIAGNNPVNYMNWDDAIAYCNKLSAKEGLTPCYTVSGITDWESFAYSSVPTSSVPTSSNSTWNAATCNFTANGYRLPTEAEWEWAARGGENYIYAGSDTIGEVAWYKENTNDSGTKEVKTKKANGYGLYDMSGNVWEWCWDWHDSISTSTAVAGPSSGSYRVLRGGCWKDGASYCTVSYRDYYYPDFRYSRYGFRVVRSAQ